MLACMAIGLVLKGPRPPNRPDYITFWERTEQKGDHHRIGTVERRRARAEAVKSEFRGCAQVNKELHKPHLPSILPGNAKGQSERGGTAILGSIHLVQVRPARSHHIGFASPELNPRHGSVASLDNGHVHHGCIR